MTILQFAVRFAALFALTLAVLGTVGMKSEAANAQASAEQVGAPVSP